MHRAGFSIRGPASYADTDLSSYYYLVEILEETNIKIKLAENGETLINLIHQQIPDIILLDINMPRIDGYEASKRIRKENINIPVIAQTAYAMPEERKKILNAGCDGYVAKPISSDELISSMRDKLGK